MPARLPCPQGLRGLQLRLRPAVKPSFQPLVQVANLSQREKAKRMKNDPYGWQQQQQRKAANVERQKRIQEIEGKEWGSPVHGVTTPFVESFDSAGQAPMSTPPIDEDGNLLEEPHELPTSPHLRNYFLKDTEVEEALAESHALTKPFIALDRERADSDIEAADLAKHEERHRKAVIALQRIADLNNGSAKDRKHANIRRCVETEVQIAILTSKIRALAQKLEGPKGNRDKNNKRSLRLLCHRRQALLRYAERKERGSGRWLHMIETLGLSPATWKKQITL
ncbi:hypothetical protein P8C59_005440 [Phyllachora maydis]|uniref:Ribosomal protein S15 n=1 Tax=Phyllachora maydis TaxID=1825666 RepID=A0AAD9MEI0_9PEZI|nr:hypothetical protein P8C59_005440 [Phyllachora maydis]